jgi:transposase InsO family protein
MVLDAVEAECFPPLESLGLMCLCTLDVRYPRHSIHPLNDGVLLCSFGKRQVWILPQAAPASERLNYKRVERLYVAERLQVRRRRRKKVPVVDRQPLIRPQRPNEVCSADFVFDRTPDGRVLKCLTIVDDATTEAVAVVPARTLGGLPVTRVLDRLAVERGLPQVLRTDNALEFCGPC